MKINCPAVPETADQYSDRSIINELGDKSGLGLLRQGQDKKGKYWQINNELFRQFILTRNETFFAVDLCASDNSRQEVVQPAPTYNITNNYIHVSNNFFNPGDAVNAIQSLLALKESAERRGKLALPEPKLITDAVQCLPYQQSGWEKLDDSEKDEKMDEYTDKIFESGSFEVDNIKRNTDEEVFAFTITTRANVRDQL